MRRLRWLLIVSVLAGVGGVVYLFVRDDPPAFTIDHTQPFWLEFGRGSGWHGLDTIKVDQTGQVVLHRMKSEHQNDVTVLSWEAGTLQLPPKAMDEVLKAVETNNVLGLRKAYQANIHDGSQWVLWIKQGTQEKSTYFDNNFPTAITRFAEQLDAILARAGLDNVAWQAIPADKSRLHEKALWDSTRR